MRRFALLAALIGGVLAAVLTVVAWRAAPPPVVVVRWTTASEVNTVGFHLARSAQPAGPFTRITTQLIPAQGDPLAGGSYTYTDAAVVAGQQYFYQLEDLDSGGVTTTNGPIAGLAARPFPRWLALAAAWDALWIAGSAWLLRRRRRA